MNVPYTGWNPRIARPAILALGLLTTVAVAQAQATNPTPSPTTPTAEQPTPATPPPSGTTPPATKASEDVVELTPFTVSADDDSGYRAANTLSGSRLNSSLADTPGAIDVLTSEFLSDIGATTLEQALEFSANFDVDNGDFDSQGTLQSAFPGAQSSLAFRTRGLGGSLARNYLETDFRPAFYTTERIDNSSGPNAILFGLGSAGGVINITTKRAKLNRDTYGLDFQFDSNNTRRVTTDVNQVLIPRTLGLRVNAIWEDTKRDRANFAEQTNGIHLASTWRVSNKTEIRVEYEQAHITGSVAYLGPTPVNPYVSNWLDRGSPVIALPANWEAFSGTAAQITAARNAIANPAGSLTAFNFYTTAVTPIVVQNGDTAYITNVATALVSSPTTAFNDPTTLQSLDPRFYTPRTNVIGPGGQKGVDREIIAIAIDHKLGESVYMNLSATREGGEADTYQAFGQGAASGAVILVDGNATLTNGAQTLNLGSTALTTNTAGQVVNPFAGQFYTQSRWRHNTQYNERDVIQGTVAGDLDLGKWFGNHRMVGTVSYSERSAGSENYLDSWLFAPFNASVDSTANQVFRRRYASPLDAENFYVPDWRDLPVLTWNHPTLGPITTGWLSQGEVRNDTRQFSWVTATQSRFIKNRLVVTAGYRVDDSYTYVFGEKIIKPPGWEASNGLTVIDPSNIRKTQTKGPTRTLGGVFRITDWMRVYYNASTNFGPPRFNLVGPDSVTAPNTAGRGKDMGIKFLLFNKKLEMDLNYYDTSSNDVAETLTLNLNTDASLRGAINGIFPILNNPNPALSAPLFNSNDPAQVAALKAAYPSLRPVYSFNGDLLDQASRGYELRLTANPTRGMRIRATFSKTERERENLYKFTTPIIEQMNAYIADLQTKNPGVNVGALATTAAPNTTIAERLSQIGLVYDNNVETLSNNFGGGKLSANLVCSYDFQRLLRGLGTTVTARYKSGPYTGAYEVREGGLSNGRLVETVPIFGESSYEYDTSIRYKTKLSWLNKTSMTLRLTVNNLLDDSDPIIRRQRTIVIAPAATPPAASDFVTTSYFIRAPRRWTLAAQFDF